MIMPIVKILLLVLLGFSFIEFIKFRGSWLEKLGLSFLVGTGLISVVYFLFIWKTDVVSPLHFWLLTILLISLFLLLRRPKPIFKRIELKEIKILPNLIPIICWTVVVVLFLASLINTSYRPVYTVDSLYLFDFRSKVMFLSQKLSEIKQIENWYSFPMFTSMVGLIWRFVGISNPSSYYPVMYFSFTLVFYSILRKVVNKTLASIGTLLVYTTPITFWQAQMDGLTNTPYTIFLCLSVLYIYKIIVSKKPLVSDVVISSLLLGLSTWTRGSEPLWAVPIIIITWIFLTKGKWALLFLYYLIFSSIREVWPLFTHQAYTSAKAAGRVVLGSVVENQSGIYGFYSSLSYTFESMAYLLPKRLGLVFYLFLALFIINLLFHKFSRDQLFYLFVILMMLLILFFGSLFMVINFHITIHVYNDSLSRLLSVLAPPMWLYIIINPAWEEVARQFKLRLK